MIARLLLACGCATLLAGAAVAAPPAPFTVYYFHGDIRCGTCIMLERATVTAVRDSFAAQLDAGDLGLEVVNFEAPGNEHFVADFALEGPQAVLVAYDGEKVRAWRDLERLWFLASEPEQVRNYLVTETRAFLADPEGEPREE